MSGFPGPPPFLGSEALRRSGTRESFFLRSARTCRPGLPTWVKAVIVHNTAAAQQGVAMGTTIGTTYLPMGATYQPMCTTYLPIGTTYLPMGATTYQPMCTTYLPIGTTYLPMGTTLPPICRPSYLGEG